MYSYQNKLKNGKIKGRSQRAYHILSEETRTELAETGLLPDYTVAL